jgi:3-oxoacyl-[acyl-carrier-protein] synthase-3
MNQTRYESLGVYLPKHIIRSKDMLSSMSFKKPNMLHGLTGIVEHRAHAQDEHSLSLARRAAEACLERSRYDGSDIDVLINASITHFHTPEKICLEPAISHYIAQAVGAKHALCFDISNACAGMMTGAYILDSMIRAGMVKTGMVVSGECNSHAIRTAMVEVKDIKDPQFASLTLGDAGAAFVLDSASDHKGRIDFIDIVTFADFAELCIGSWNDRIGGISMYSDLAELDRVGAGERFSRFLLDLLAKHGRELDREHYDHVIFHQVSVQMVKKHFSYFASHFNNLDLPNPLISAHNRANTSTTTHTVALNDALRAGRVTQGDRILMVVQASGINLGLVSLTVGELEV